MSYRITKEKLLLIKEFLKSHPKVIAAYGYGSGVIPQAGSNPNDKKEIDLILIVDDLLQYFKDNLEINPQEFTKDSRRYFQKANLEKLEKGAPIVYLNHIKYNDASFKTGVMSQEKFLSSCFERASSYVPFRIEKPIAEIVCDNEEIRKAILYDRQMTLILCLLMLKENEKTLNDLFTKICSISYLGDFRVKIKCEDPNKIHNLVNGQFDFFVEDYAKVNKDYYNVKNGYLEINYANIFNDIHLIPNVIKKAIYLDRPSDLIDSQVAIYNLQKFYINEAKRENLLQAIKGIQTAGIANAVTYGLRKVKKGRQR